MARNFAHLLMGQVGTTVLGIGLTAMLGRWLSAGEYGDYYLYLRLWGFAFVVVEWGQQQYIIRELARRPERTNALLSASLAIRVVGGLLAAVVIAVVTLALYDRRSAFLATLALVTMLPFLLAQGYGWTFRGRERMENAAVIDPLNKGLTLGFTVVLLLAGWALPGAILAQFAAGAGTLAVAVMLAHGIGIRVRLPDGEVIREILVGGTSLVMMYLASEAQGAIDPMIVKALVPAATVGWFGAAKNVIGTLMAPAMVLGGAAFPRLSRAAKDPAQFRAEIQAAMRPVLLMAAYVAVGTFVCANLAVDVIYGKDRFDPAGPILQIAAPSFFLFFVDVLLGAAIVAAGRALSMAIAKIVNVVVSSGLAFVLVPYFERRFGNGGLGAQLAYGGSELIMFAAALMIIPPGALGRRFVLDFGRAVLAAAGAVGAAIALAPLGWTWSDGQSWGGTLLALALATAVFAALSWTTRLVTRADVETMKNLFRRGGAQAET
jgi:O-antigen/teichoic acid export membrane protein